MNNLSNERLQKIASWREKYGNGHNVVIPAEEAEAIVRELLAYREAQGKPVLWEISNPGEGSYYTPHKPEPGDYRHELIIAEFYAVPQLPAVPDEIAPDDVPGLLDPAGHPDEYACCVGADMWNKCRAAMLSAAPKPGSDNVTDSTAQQFESLSKRSANE